MQKINNRIFGTLVLILVLLSSCSLALDHKAPEDSLVIVSWNLQNLMDGKIDGTEYDNYKRKGVWDEGSYKKRIESFAKVIVGMDPQPDILVLQEVENETVVKDLTKALSEKGFRYYGCTNDTNSAIQTAIISKIELKSENCGIISVEGLRSVLKVSFEYKKQEIVLYALHAKSKVEGEIETEEDRKKQFLAIKQAFMKSPGCLGIIAGDFNEDIALNVKQAVSVYPNGEILSVSGSKQLVNERGLWYCFWADNDVQKLKNGSYYYNGQWERIDNIILSSEAVNKIGLDFDRAGVYAEYPFVNTYGLPNSFDLNTKTGYSDHLPVYVVLK